VPAEFQRKKGEDVKTTFFARLKIPHVFTLLTGVVLFCSLLTYVVPSGSYQRESRTYGELTRTVVLPGTYEQLPKQYSLKGTILGDQVENRATPVGLVGFLSAIPRGMEAAADIIFFIFIIGGVFGILQRTGTIAALIQKLLDRFAHSGPLLTVVLMTTLAVGGSTLGMGEEFIPLVPIFLIVANRLGYDRIYGLALVSLSSAVGFASATTNPFTVQIAQGIAEIPPGSGLLFRLAFFACSLVVMLVYVLRYGSRVKADPTRSLLGKDGFQLPDHQFKRQALTAAHLWILLAAAVIFAFVLYAVQSLGWWLAEMSGGFLLIGFAAAAIARLSISETTQAFVKGMEEMVVAALVVGFARGIQVVLVDGQIMDSLIYAAAGLLQIFPRYIAAEGMFLFQSVLNFFIPSGSGQAAVTMPLMAPLADVLGLTRQTAVFAFTSGDGLSNTLIPTSGVLMAMLALAKIPYEKWLRFVFPLFVQLSLLAGIFLAIAVWIDFQ
jgi:uncharacterized ion transporter superfamily protein YfcC